MARDTGYAWLVCGAAFCNLFVTLGLHYSCGVIFIALLDTFGESKAKTAWVQSISQFMLFFFCPLASILMDRYGARAVTIAGGILMSVGLFASSFVERLNTLYFTYGTMFGFGTALAYLPTLVMVGHHFEKHRSLATGIATCGSNAGAVSLASLQQLILRKYGWKNVFRFTGGFSLLVILCGIIYRPPVEQTNSIKPTSQRSPKKRAALLLRNPRFLLWCIATTIGCFGYFIPHVHLIRYAKDNNITSHGATHLITFISIGSATGKLFFGKLSSHFQKQTPAIYVVAMFLSGLSSILFSFVSSSYAGLVVYAIVLGLLDGSFIGLMSIMTFWCAGSAELMSDSWGISLMFMSCSMLVGPPTVGWLKEYDMPYKSLFYLAGGPMIIGSFLLAPTIWMKSGNLDVKVENSLVVMNEQNSEIDNEQAEDEVQRLTVV